MHFRNLVIQSLLLSAEKRLKHIGLVKWALVNEGIQPIDSDRFEYEEYVQSAGLELLQKHC